MQKKLHLLPYRFQAVGWTVALLSSAVIIGGMLFVKKPFFQNDYAIVGLIFLIIGVFIVGFSREKLEDEFTMHLRVSSAMTSMLVIFGLWLVTKLATPFLARLVKSDFFINIHLIISFLTSFVAVFVLYLALFKIRLASIDRKSAYEE